MNITTKAGGISMKIQKRVVALGLTGLMMASLAPGASALSAMQKPAVQSDIEIVREDVSREEAMRDPTFNLGLSQALSESDREARGARWNVWGDTEKTDPTTTHPIGYSEHVNSEGEVLDTYHYTRTYLTNGVRKAGDSGRVWGSGTVKAVGGACLDALFWEMRHDVKYGTEG